MLSYHGLAFVFLCSSRVRLEAGCGATALERITLIPVSVGGVCNMKWIIVGRTETGAERTAGETIVPTPAT